MSKTVIIAAMKQEIAPLLQDRTFVWRANSRVHAVNGAWDSATVALVCGGVGHKPAFTATLSAIQEFQPTLVVSAGLAGALVPGLHVAQVLRPATVVSSTSGDIFQIANGRGKLVTASGVAGEEGKRLLARHFSADAADMEAAAVAAAARQHGIEFAAVKAISDDHQFEMPPLDDFISADGRFLQRRFAIYLLVRPRLWPAVRQLAANSKIASLELCRELRNLIQQHSSSTQELHAGRPRESQPTR
jgi:adenosylhomocysteine nucleosidase